eukprot:4588414-Prorocentrum_lima.AAC.1
MPSCLTCVIGPPLGRKVLGSGQNGCAIRPRAESLRSTANSLRIFRAVNGAGSGNPIMFSRVKIGWPRFVGRA